ncbi:MAG: endolytic transglycosylase MltG [Clostridia bacterium]|nr:endolytic transglycosylase MltG [Clostridia bacterium]
MSEASAGYEKKNLTRRKKKAVFRLALFLFIAAVTLASGIYSYKYVIEEHAKKKEAELPEIPEGKGIEFEVEKGSSTDAIAKKLAEQGLIDKPLLFKLISKINGFDGMYRAGTHIVSKGLKYEELMRILCSEPETVKVFLQEGLTAKEIAAELAKLKLVDAQMFRRIMNSEKFAFKFLENIPQREYKLEGYLFPDTYKFDLKAGEKGIINTLLENFDRKFKPEFYKKAEELKMTVDQVIILASIIEKEAQVPEDRTLISSVFHNRLNSKDKTLRRLQSCATIKYIFLNKQGIEKKKITEKDTKVSDPYNTYEHEGLPPGPICSPGLDSIIAALNPEKTDYLYFVAKGDGTHHFSKTYKEHQAAMKKYGVN